MAVKIRLARKGRKKLAYYHIVVADSRSPRDGRYIEKIGSYNPVTNPATIELDFDKAMGWLQNGAIPTDTCRAILSYKGVLMKKHLLDGVKKGAFDEAEANKRFEEWMKANEAKIEAKKSGLEKSRDDEKDKRLQVEKDINEARAAKLAKRNAELAAKEAAADVAETPVAEAPAEETPAEEAPVAETQVDETAVAEAAVEETVVEEAAVEETNVKETPVAETEQPAVEQDQAPVAEDTASEEATEDTPRE
jgi:small subunit ribosomal protein S16